MIVKSPKSVYDFADVIEYIDGILTFGTRQVSIYFPKGTTVDGIHEITHREEKHACGRLLTKSQASELRDSFEEIRKSVVHAGEFLATGVIAFSGIYRQNEDYTWGTPITIFVNPPVPVEKYRFDIGEHFKTVIIHDMARKMR